MTKRASFFSEQWDATVQYIGNQASLEQRKRDEGWRGDPSEGRSASSDDGVVALLQRRNRQKKSYTMHLGN